MGDGKRQQSYEASLQQKEAVIDRFRERVLALEAQVQSLVDQEYERHAVDTLSASLQREREENERLRLRGISAPTEITSILERLESGNVALREINLVLSQRLEALDVSYQRKLSAQQSAFEQEMQKVHHDWEARLSEMQDELAKQVRDELAESLRADFGVAQFQT